jgi:hypothetical protein
MSKEPAADITETLKLTEWELANLHLPPVTTVTLYEGSAPVEFLRSRIACLLEKNPWLTSRIVKKNTVDGVVAMAYTKGLDAESVVDDHLSVYEPGKVALSLDKPYEELVRCLLPLQCARSKPATDNDEVLFKVSVVPIEAEAGGSDQSAPLQHSITLPGFALVVSMNHTLGDGHTYYRLYSMLGIDTQLEELDPVRVPGFEEAKTDIIGSKETAMFSSAGLSFGILGTYLGAKFGRRPPQNVCVNEVDAAWVGKEKTRGAQEAQVPFVSSNDVLTSWFFREMNSDLHIMVANFRSRRPSVLNLTDAHVGNYEANLPYFPGDIETPALIRQSIRDADGAFRAKRAGSPATELPSFSKLLRNRTSIVTNWASFYCDVKLQNDVQDTGEDTLEPKLHFPIMESDGIITSVWNNAIIFRPRAGKLGVLMITRRFDKETLARGHQQEGPLGKRIL